MGGNFQDVIDGYSNGQTGTIALADGNTVNYTVNRDQGSVTNQSHVPISEKSGFGTQAAGEVEIVYDRAVEGVNIYHRNSNSPEDYVIKINGEAVDLNTLVASGNVVVYAPSAINAAGNITGASTSAGSGGGILITGIPITSIGITGSQDNTNGIDGFDIGIDSVTSGLAGAVCFARGMMIATDRGDIAVEDLKLGDMVRTFDNGFQPIRFVYGWNVAAQGKKRPIVFEVGTIGNTKRIIVSQEHKILIDSVRRDLMPAPLRREDQMIKASLLVNGRNVFIDRTVKSVEYFHIMFDQHELIFCNGSVSESWQPKERNLRRNPALRSALLAQFPEFRALPNLARRPVRNEVCVFQKQGKNYIASTDNRRPS